MNPDLIWCPCLRLGKKKTKKFLFPETLPTLLFWGLLQMFLGHLRIFFYLCPQLRGWRGILVSRCPCVHPFMCPFLTLFDACHILWILHASLLKFHIRIPHGKLAEPYFFSCLTHLPFWSYASLKKWEWDLMHAISYQPCMLAFWNFIYGFLMEK